MRLLTVSLMLFLIVNLVQAQNAVSAEMASQTQEDVTITLEHAYADIAEVVIWFRIEGLDLPDGQLMGAPIINVAPSAEGYSHSFFGASGGGYTIAETGMIEGEYQFDLTETTREEIHFTFDISINQSDVMPLWIVPDDFEIDSVPSDEYAYELPYDLTFSLPITLTPEAGEILEPELSADSNDLNLSIERIVLTSMRANVIVCFDLPTAEDWQPDMHLEINGEATQLMGYGLESLPSADDNSRCSHFNYRLPVVENPSELVFSVESLFTPMPENPSVDHFIEAQIMLAEQGIEVNFNVQENGFSYEIVSKPDDMAEADANRLVYESLRIHFDASWEFVMILDE